MDDKIFTQKVDSLIKDIKVEGQDKEIITQKMMEIFQELTYASMTKKLQIMHDYEKHYLELIKNYKEEIKFANSTQEDLRRERAQFFTQILKDVSETLKASQVESNVASQWVQELVTSYTKSLDLSGDLAKTHVLDIIGKLREDSKKIIAENIEQPQKK